jgi:succinate dehydrogenase / fumarate reductase flavoprotein subunit
VGEAACVSLHGANRLGTNSLGDLVVFGRRAGLASVRFSQVESFVDLPPDAADPSRELIDGIKSRSQGETPFAIRKDLQETMMDNASVFRTEELLEKQVGIVQELMERYRNVVIQDKGDRFNADLIDALELGFLLDNAEALVHSAKNRKESRGAHAREDYPDRDDDNWLKHTLVYREAPGKVRFAYKPVVLGRFEPKPRTY